MNRTVEYYTVKIDSVKELTWVYSAEELQSSLEAELKGQTLKRLFVSLYGYLASQRKAEDLFDFSYMGGTLLLCFDRTVLELSIHGAGLMQYRLMSAYEVKLPPYGRIDRPPLDTGLGGGYYYDLGKELTEKCLGMAVDGIAVAKTEAYPFDPAGFDREMGAKAEERGDLPESVELLMQGGTALKFIGDNLEYFVVRIGKR